MSNHGTLTLKACHGRVYSPDLRGSMTLMLKLIIGDKTHCFEASSKGKQDVIFDGTIEMKREYEDKICLELWKEMGEDYELIGKGAIDFATIVTKANRWNDWVILKNRGKIQAEVFMDIIFSPEKLMEERSDKHIKHKTSRLHHHISMVRS